MPVFAKPGSDITVTTTDEIGDRLGSEWKRVDADAKTPSTPRSRKATSSSDK